MRLALVSALAFCCLCAAPARAAFVAEAAEAGATARAPSVGAVAQWTRPLAVFFSASAPSLDSVRGLSGELGRIDPADPSVRSQLEPVRAQLRAAAAELLEAPAAGSSEAALRASAEKLTLLNQPAVRGLLSEDQQRRIPAAFWAYQSHLIEDVRLDAWTPSKLSLAEKIAGIARALDDSRASRPGIEIPSLRSGEGVAVEVRAGDAARVRASGLISAVQLSGLCHGGINAMIDRASPCFGRQIEAAKPLKDGQVLLARGDASNKGLFENVVFVADDMRLPLREIVLRGLNGADAAGLSEVALPVPRTGWNFGFIEKTYEEVVTETAAGIEQFLAGRPDSVKRISVIVHNNPTLLELLRAAKASGDLEPLASSLRREPINGASYGSEAGFLADFSRSARERFPTREALTPETRLLLALERQGARGSALFPKNLAIVADDLYLWTDPSAAPEERLALAGLRARFGAAAVRALDPAEIPVPAPDSAIRGQKFARLLPGEFGAALREALGFISARDLSAAGFPSVVERWARSPELRARLVSFEERLEALNDGFETAPETSVWKLALEVNGGDARDAVEMLGGIIGQTKRPLRYVERELIPRSPEARGSEEAFVQAARAYYLLGLVHEKGMARFGRSGLYPPGSNATGPKFWHFYGAAMVAARLDRHAGLAGKAAGVAIGAGYEAVSLRHNLALLRSKGPFRALAFGLVDAWRDVASHGQGHDFGRGLLLGAPPSRAPIVVADGARARLRRARSYALNAWWQFWWNAGPPVAELWSGYRARLKAAEAAGVAPSVRDPKGLFVSLRLLGLSVRAGPVAEGVAPDEAVLSEARALFARHIAAGPEARDAFGRFLDRAALYNPGRSRAKLRSLAAYYLRESSLLPSSDLAAYYDGLARDDEALAGARADGPGILADFKTTADRLILEANASALPGRRVLGFVVSGSFAKGAPRPGSDLDLQLVTEDGRAPRADLVSSLERAWSALHPAVELEVFSNSYLPPDAGLLRVLHPETYLIVSPYPEAVALLSRADGASPRAPPPARAGALSGASRAVLKAWLRALLAARDLSGAFRSAPAERERSLRLDLRPAELSGRGFSLRPRMAGPVLQDSPIYEDMLKPWDLSRMMRSHKPVRLGTIEDRAAFSAPSPSVLNMPIKMPGTDFRLPVELAQYREFVQKMIDHEAAINPRLDEFYAYITVDQHPVKAGETHRKGGIHIDGVQGARYKVKLLPEHTYSASDAVGTVFYDQVFDLRHVDPATQHVHAELERQARPDRAFAAEDYGIYFWDSYSVHEAAAATQDTMRTFVRVEFSQKVYDSVGDTVSPLFDYDWPRTPRPIPAYLDDQTRPR